MRIGYQLFGPSSQVNYNGVIDRYNLSTSQVMQLAGANLGNLAFKYGAMGLLSEEHEIVYITYASDVEYVKKNVDILVLPEANLINGSIDYTHPANFISNVDKPCILLGVGAQAVNLESDVILHPGTLRYLQEVSKRTSNILVRGDFTKSVLEKIGITNTLSSGCPSLMINGSKHLWQKIKKNLRTLTDFDNIAVTEGVYPSLNRTANLDKLERRLFDMVVNGSADYVAQVQTSVISNALKNIDCINEDDMYYLRKYLCPAVSQSKFSNIASSRFKAFTKLDDWLMYYKGKQSVIGTRIHGNFIALQAETPALPVVHDSRTKELCQTMKIPFLELDEASEISTTSDLSDAYDIIRNSNTSELEQHRSSLASLYINELNELGIKESSKLRHIASV